MGLFNSEMTPAKAIEALGSDKEVKVEKGAEFLLNEGTNAVPIMIEHLQTNVSQAARSKRHQQTATKIYELLCRLEIPADLCPAFIKVLMSAPENPDLSLFNLNEMPAYVIENSYGFLSDTLQDGDPGSKKKTVPFLEQIGLPVSILPVLGSLLTRDSGFAEEALVLIQKVEGDLSPVSDPLYSMLDLYPLGDLAVKTIPELGDRLPPNIGVLDKYLSDYNSMAQKRAVKVAVPLAEYNNAVYALLKKAILADESGRAYILEALEKKESLLPNQMDLIWMILNNTDSQLTEERGMKFFGRTESQIRPLVLHYSQKGERDEIICALKCIRYMKGESARICAELLFVYLNDDALLFDTAGYPVFSYLAGLLKENCPEAPTTPALAKKMRDYCVRENMETPTEVMALLGPEDLADVIEWSFKRIFDSYGIGYTAEYANEMMAGISELVGFEKATLVSFIKAIGYSYSFDSAENKPVLAHKDTAAAINRLRAVNTPATCNLLHLVSRKKDITLSQKDATGAEVSSVRLSFEEHRRLAIDELERRGFPSYAPVNYLKVQKPHY
ncbi:MAG: hypothetical protein FWE78_02040 [Methanimicrococcus sp.]|nr:hypothetical protein [Methanimicrococcus sp.]